MGMAVMERRLQLLLDEERYRRVADEAERSGRSVAPVIREAVDADSQKVPSGGPTPGGGFWSWPSRLGTSRRSTIAEFKDWLDRDLEEYLDRKTQQWRLGCSSTPVLGNAYGGSSPFRVSATSLVAAAMRLVVACQHGSRSGVRPSPDASR